MSVFQKDLKEAVFEYVKEKIQAQAEKLTAA